MKIGIDLDEVLVNTFGSFLNYYNSKHKTNFQIQDVHSYHLWEIFGCSRGQVIMSMYQFQNTDLFANLPPAEQAEFSIAQLSRKNEFYVLTSRPEICRGQTETWIAKHFPLLLQNLYFTSDFHPNNSKPKSGLCLDLRIELMLEDAPRYALECAEAGVKTFLFDKPWNQEVSHPKITRVKNWQEALKEITNTKLINPNFTTPL